METNLQHEDLLMQLRGKLNEGKIKLWEPPYYSSEQEITESLKELATKFSSELSISNTTCLHALQELQLHSIDRSKANEAFKETGVATLRVKATAPGQKPKVVKVQMKLEQLGGDLIADVAKELAVSESRLKLIHSGKMIKPSPSIGEQGIKNGVLIMALIMQASPEEAQQEDKLYMEMKSTRDDAMLLSECVDDHGQDDDYMQLEDQSGKSVQVPASERRSLMVGLALHERGRAALRQRDFPLALVLLLEADRQFSECRSDILHRVDNWAVLQLDVAWCYCRLGASHEAAAAATSLRAAEQSLRRTYDSANANSRVLFMRLYLLQGIVAYHQNQRDEARRLLDLAEEEMKALRVDEDSVVTLMELGWSSGQARAGLRAARGELTAAHTYLHDRKEARAKAREAHRQQRILGFCMDGAPVNATLVKAIEDMGFDKKLVIAALRAEDNSAADAIRRIQDHPETLVLDSESSDDEPSDEGEYDQKLVDELAGMGYSIQQARTALKLANNHVDTAVDLLMAGEGCDEDDNGEDPSTSAAGSSTKKKRPKKQRDEKKKEREAALSRLTSSIKTTEEEHLDTSLQQEQEMLAQYRSLL